MNTKGTTAKRRTSVKKREKRFGHFHKTSAEGTCAGLRGDWPVRDVGQESNVIQDPASATREQGSSE